jgi:hypothetical protein
MSSKQSKGNNSKPSSSSTKGKSPPFRARDFKNEVKIGVDGKPWVSIPNKNMNYSWQPYGGTAHDKYIERAAVLGDIDKINSLDTSESESESPVEDSISKKVPPKKSQSTKKPVPKKTTENPTPKKTVTKKTTPKYTKKVDKTGRVMYYNATGKRTAKKNVPEEYL